MKGIQPTTFVKALIMIVEIKIVKTGTDFVIGHNAWFVECGRVEVAQIDVADYIERVCGELDADDVTDIRAFNTDNQISSRFGPEWEYFVEAIIIDEDECDIDPEFDSISDKYKFCL
jgi:hypothetical protein